LGVRAKNRSCPEARMDPTPDRERTALREAPLTLTPFPKILAVTSLCAVALVSAVHCGRPPPPVSPDIFESSRPDPVAARPTGPPPAKIPEPAPAAPKDAFAVATKPADAAKHEEDRARASEKGLLGSMGKMGKKDGASSVLGPAGIQVGSDGLG